ncbi:MAG: glycerophosphodiester phosphodiesterase [Thiohalomonadaceae bacterium]
MAEITAHRAGAALGLENSLQALAQSIAYGTPWAEIDVQLTADGVVVVFHDPDLRRLADDPRRVRDLPFAELPPLTGGIRVPTLAEFIAAARGRIRLNIELKDYGDGPDLAVRVAEFLKAQGFARQATVCSFNPAVVEELKRRAPEVPAGHVLEAGPLPAAPAEFVSVAWQGLTPELVRTAHDRGMGVHVWTVNDGEHMLRLLAMGVDKVITDDPATGMATLRAFRSLNPWRRAWLRWRA